MIRMSRNFFPMARQPPPVGKGAPSFTRFLDHTQRRTTVSRTPLDERSARRRDLTTHNIHKTDIHAPGGIRTRTPSQRALADSMATGLVMLRQICVK